MNDNLKINESILLTIKKIGINGEGVAFYKRKAVFVEGALPDEVVEVKIKENFDKYATGTIIKTKTTSTYRVKPECQYYGKCGGCQLQHLSYEGQLMEKRNLVIEAFERYYDGSMSEKVVKNTLGMETPWHYRNKSSLPCRHDGDKVVAGMYALNSNHLVFIDNCPIEEELITEVRQNILNILTKEKVDIYNPKSHTGSLRYIVIRAFSKENVQVTFVMTKKDIKLINVLKQLKVKSTSYSINEDPKSIEIFGEEIVYVTGKGIIEGKLNDIKFEVSPNAFFQLNQKQTLKLYEEIKKACKLTGNEKVIDCYCGIGSIALYLADAVKEVRGIDINPIGIENAKKNAKINDIDNAKFYSGNILPHFHQFKDEGFISDILVVDPPRKGLELNIINYIQRSNIRRIIYVSCNPATLAKNINHLQREYIVRYIQPVDMFPQTANVECVVCLERR